MIAREQSRYKFQKFVDNQKSVTDRRTLGQFSTPYKLAREIMDHCIGLIPDKEFSFLEPSVGSGVFLSALLDSGALVSNIVAYDIDVQYLNIAVKLFGSHKNTTIIEGDFTIAKPKKFDLIVTNPPYVRHHLINHKKKKHLIDLVKKTTGIQVSGLAGLYVYFVLLSINWLQDEGISAWLIPSEFMDVNYGDALREFLSTKVELLRIHKYDPKVTQFEDALVSSSVVVFRNRQPLEHHKPNLSFGGSIEKPSILISPTVGELKAENKWSKLFFQKNNQKKHDFSIGDFFDIKRGIATGCNDYFILNDNQIKYLNLPKNEFIPILPSPRKMQSTVIEADTDGMPTNIEKLFLLNLKALPIELLLKPKPLIDYINNGIGTVSENYLCRKRNVWYVQEERAPAKILCSYFGRKSDKKKNTFCFFYNKSNAIATNSYLMLYPKEELKTMLEEQPDKWSDIWKAFNSINDNATDREARDYGGGLKKLEPSELSNVGFIDVYRLF